jgi:hypothetical protein
MLKRFSLGLVALCCGAVIVSGCSRDIESKNPVRSLPTAPPSPIHLSAVLNDRAVTLSWEVSDTAAVDRFRVYALKDTVGDYELIDSTEVFSILISDLPFYRTVRLRVTSVTSNNVESNRSAPIDVVTGLLQMLIQEGAEYTLARDVEVQFAAPVTPLYVELSESPTLAGAVIMEYQSPMPFVLSQGDGVKTVYARLTFPDGSESGEILSDQITLDTYARIDSVYFAPTGRTFSAGDTIRFYVDAGGEVGGGAQAIFGSNTRVLLRDLGTNGDQVAGDGIYSFAWVVPVGLTVTDATVSGAFTDAAGNNAVAALSSRKLNIRTSQPPAAVTLAVGLVNQETAHLSWTVNGDDDFVSYRVYRSVSPDPIDSSNTQFIIAIIVDQNQTTHDDFLSGTGTYHYKVFVFDSEGRATGSNQVQVSL